MKLIGRLLLTWLFVYLSLASYQPSPCPGVFKFENSTPENDRWYGEITLRSNESLVGIRLDIEFDRPTELLMTWNGQVTANSYMKYTILNLSQRLKSGFPALCRIMIKYDPSGGSPNIQSIQLNRREICPDKSTYISYEESSRPQTNYNNVRPNPELQENVNLYTIDGGNDHSPNTVSLQSGELNTNVQIHEFISEFSPIPSGTNTNIPTKQPSSNVNPETNKQVEIAFNSDINIQQSSSSSTSCGKVSLAIPLVTKGQDTQRGQWPWHIALYMIDGINLHYNCGGSLVSKNKVITAAHCVTNKDDVAVNSKKLVIYLGKYHQLQYSDELGIQTKQVTRVNVFPSYNSTNYLGDIAVLTLSSNVEYTKYVSPVCLWDNMSNDLADIVDKEGTVVGWGHDENDTPTEELKMATMPVVSNQVCIKSYPKFYSEYTSPNTTFCAGFRNGTSVCNGDSGGGMVFNRDSQWYLRGIVSLTVSKTGLRICDTSHFVVFTDVAKYLDFIKKNL